MRCQGRDWNCSRKTQGRHAVCNGKRARLAAIYHSELCRSILVGFRKQLVRDGLCTDGFLGMRQTEEDDIPLMHIGLSDAEVLNILTN